MGLDCILSFLMVFSWAARAFMDGRPTEKMQFWLWGGRIHRRIFTPIRLSQILAGPHPSLNRATINQQTRLNHHASYRLRQSLGVYPLPSRC